MKRAWILWILILAGLSEAQEKQVGVYRIDPGRSKITAEVDTGGVFGFMGHPHHITVGTFTGEIHATTKEPEKASLEIVIIADSLKETGEFSEKDLNTIHTKMKGEVLKVSTYPEIVFKSTKVSASMTKEGEYKTTIEGDMTLHGVTRKVIIPALVHINEDMVHTSGTFEILRDHFNIKTDSAGGGTVKVAKEIKISFNILATR